MKKVKFLLAPALLIFCFNLNARESSTGLENENFAEASDSTGLLGDNFSLEAALAVFKNSESPEDFEKKLNESSTHVNNLDLNDDGKVDYIRVTDETENDAHALVLQAVLGKNEAQDIAVIAIEKTGKNEAVLQIFGDEYIYGKDMIVEPFDYKAEQSESENGPAGTIKMTRVVVNVWFWNPVRFIYRPVYRPWRSPFYWGHYPRVWKPWRPVGWHVHFGRVSVYRPRYRVVATPRVVRARTVYTPRRTTSVVVKTKSVRHTPVPRKSVAVKQKTTTTRVVKTKNGNTAVAKKTTTKTTVKNKRGNTVAAKKTTRTKSVKKNNRGVKTTKTKKTTKKARRH